MNSKNKIIKDVFNVYDKISETMIELINQIEERDIHIKTLELELQELKKSTNL